MADDLSLAFSALADPTRRDMVTRLADGDATVSSLAEGYDLSLQAVSKHLKVLSEANIVSARVDAQRRIYRVEPERFREIDAWLDSEIGRAEIAAHAVDSVQTPDRIRALTQGRIAASLVTAEHIYTRWMRGLRT